MRSPVFVLPLALSGCIVVAKGGSPPDPSSPAPTHVQTVTTSRAPAPVGPYSQARLAGNTLYLAGQIGLDPETGEMVAGGVEAETRQAMANLNAVLRSAGFTFEDVVSTQVFLADIGDYAAMNGVFAEHFDVSLPARAVVGATPPKGARVEILMTAVRR